MYPFVKVQCFWLLMSMLLPALCWALVLMDSADPYTMSNIALPTVLFSWIAALATPFVWPSDASRQQRFTAFVVTWSVIAIFFPLTWDLPWAILHEWVNGATEEDKWKWYFWAYAVADTRFLKSDPVMITVEYWSGIIGIIEIYCLSQIFRNNLKKAYGLFIMAGSLAFYGCTVFFSTEAMAGFANIRPDIFSYIKFFGMNGMWVITPIIAGYMFKQLIDDPRYYSQQTLNELLGRQSKLEMAASAS